MNVPVSAPPQGASVPLLEEIIEGLPQGLLVFDAGFRVVLVNRAYQRLMGGEPVLVGERMEDLVRRRIAAGDYGPGDPELLLARQLAYDTTRPQTRRWRQANGTILENRWVPMRGGGFMVICSDITAMVGAEQALVRRGAETETMLGALRHGLILWGADQRLVAANPMAAMLMGVPPAMLAPGQTFGEFIDGLLAAGYLGSGRLARAAVAELKGRDWSRPWVRHFVNPQGRFIERRADPVAGGMNITTFTDITDQREAEYALRRAKEAAEAASQAKSRFLATMSHELRTPLNAVIGYSEALVNEAAGVGGQVAEYAGAVHDAGRRLLGLIDTLLDVARLETGRFDLADDAVDVVRLVHTTLRQFVAAAEAGEVALATALPEPHPGGLPMVLADRRRLAQILHQLLSNAVKFTPPGGRVTVGARREAERLVMWVADTGIGIAEADLARVCDPFTQVDAGLARRFSGAGLGLYLARAMIECHGGALVLTSRQGEGTRAEIQLPPHRLLPNRPSPDSAAAGLERAGATPHDVMSSAVTSGPVVNNAAPASGEPADTDVPPRDRPPGDLPPGDLPLTDRPPTDPSTTLPPLGQQQETP
ncbi:MAG: PAS-domain containing protein [Rhodospirillales bacterium]|nr:PAS-domain containing protein [Rhodospirillales bacterium]